MPIRKLQKTFQILGHRNYRLYFTGQFISLIGQWIQIVAMGWLVYRITDSEFQLGMVGFLSRIPTFFIAPFAGVLIDHYNKYRLLMFTQMLLLVQSAILAGLVYFDVIQVWHILILGFISGMTYSFEMPARQSFIVEIIPRKEDLKNAIVINSLLVNITRLIGPSLAAGILVIFNESACFSINAIAYIPVVITLSLMTVSRKKKPKVETQHWKQLKEGFHYIRNSASISTLLILLSLVSLVGLPYQVLMPVFAKDILNGDAHTLGFLMAAISIGGISGGIYLASRDSTKGLEKVVAASTCIFGIGLVVFSISTNFWLSFISLPFVGFGMMAQMTASNTILQVLVEDDKRGRVMSFYTMAFLGTIPFGNLLAGSMAKEIGAPYTVFIGGIACLIATICFIFKLPAIRKEGRMIEVQRSMLPPQI